MIKDLIKIAGRLDSLGLKKEADFIDSLISKIASDDGRIRYDGKLFLDEEQAAKVHNSYRGKPTVVNYISHESEPNLVKIYSSHPWENDAPQFLRDIAREDVGLPAYKKQNNLSYESIFKN